MLAHGYFGGLADLIGQRLTEIWESLPFLYVVIIRRGAGAQRCVGEHESCALIADHGGFLVGGQDALPAHGNDQGEVGDYVSAVRLLGASSGGSFFRHILPNMAAILVTFLPFTISISISMLTALDFLNFGLPRPMPSWGELLEIGLGAASHAPWIVTSTVCASPSSCWSRLSARRCEKRSIQNGSPHTNETSPSDWPGRADLLVLLLAGCGAPIEREFVHVKHRVPFPEDALEYFKQLPEFFTFKKPEDLPADLKWESNANLDEIGSPDAKRGGTYYYFEADSLREPSASSVLTQTARSATTSTTTIPSSWSNLTRTTLADASGPRPRMGRCL